jgi:hypothetical protein
MPKIPSVFPEIAALMAKIGVDECGNYLLGVRTQ